MSQNDPKLKNMKGAVSIQHFNNAIQARFGKREITLVDSFKGKGYTIIMRRKVKSVTGTQVEAVFETKSIKRTTIGLSIKAINMIAYLSQEREKRKRIIARAEASAYYHAASQINNEEKPSEVVSCKEKACPRNIDAKD